MLCCGAHLIKGPLRRVFGSSRATARTHQQSRPCPSPENAPDRHHRRHKHHKQMAPTNAWCVLWIRRFAVASMYGCAIHEHIGSVRLAFCSDVSAADSHPHSYVSPSCFPVAPVPWNSFVARQHPICVRTAVKAGTAAVTARCVHGVTRRCSAPLRATRSR